jgi:hypothetical protein
MITQSIPWIQIDSNSESHFLGREAAPSSAGIQIRCDCDVIADQLAIQSLSENSRVELTVAIIELPQFHARIQNRWGIDKKLSSPMRGQKIKDNEWLFFSLQALCWLSHGKSSMESHLIK